MWVLQRHNSACASALSDQYHRYSLSVYRQRQVLKVFVERV